MKLLLVEDEMLIRKGIYLKTDWKRCGIEEVRLAEDGSDAVRIAEEFQPDILLTDIRMPRLDGIEAARSIRKFCPKVRIIFMSGFSDKEYLKAAITLQSVHYLEKPIQMEELQEAVSSASRMVMEERRADLGELESLPLIKREIALLLLSAAYPAEKLDSLLPLLGIGPSDPFDAACAILKWPHPIDPSGVPSQTLEAAARRASLDAFGVLKDDRHFVVHLLARPDPESPFEERLPQWIDDVASCLPKQPGYQLAIGRRAQGWKQLHASYVTAVVQLQRGFYRPLNVVLRENDSTIDSGAFRFDEEKIRAFSRMLQEGETEKSKKWLGELAREFRRHPDTLVSYTKNVFLQVYQAIRQSGKDNGVPELRQEPAAGTVVERLYASHTLEELLAILNAELDVLFDHLESRKGNTIVRQVVQYIERHYGNRELSLTEISEYVGVTVPHMCFVFKEGMHVTIKHYLSEYRINRAKQLLSNKELKLFDIALQVGYGDGEYFSKIFKKVTGMQPSEYRKRVADE